MSLWLAVDVALCGALVWLAWRTLAAADLFQAAVHLIVFGMLMAAVWARLDAPDLAMAEAAIGAGLTGALFLSTLAVLERARGPR